MDGQSQPHQQESITSSPPTIPSLHPGPPALHEYYHHLPPPPSYPPGSVDLSTGTPGISRYPIPPSHSLDQRSIGGRSKKEIKRRTKTGCVTCRKRRIKCDETHPTCRNCQKSKRECEGYDPIFKQQQPPQANIQPAPPLSNSRLPPPPAPAPLPSASTYPPHPHHSYSQISPGYAPSTNPAYAFTLPPPVPTSYGSPVHSSYTVRHPPFDHSTVPRRNVNMAGTQEQAYASMHHAATGASGDDAMRDTKREADTPGGGPDRKASASPSPSASEPKELPGSRVLKMEHLYMIGGVEPPTPKLSKPVTPEMEEEIKFFYMGEYARGINDLLETSWYTSKGVDALFRDKKVCGMFADMLELFGATRSQDYDIMRQLPSTESRMVWTLMCLPRGPQEAAKEDLKVQEAVMDIQPPTGLDLDGVVDDVNTQSTSSAPQQVPYMNDLQSEQVRHRLWIFENLVLGKRLPFNPLAQSVQTTNPTTQDAIGRQALFWQYLGEFATLTGSTSGDSIDQGQQQSGAMASLQISTSLAKLRTMLDGLESRDVLYSIAVVRAIAPRFSDFPDGFTSQPYDPHGDRERMALVVAKKFVEDQASGKGTGQVVQRLCGMAVRGWVCGWGLAR